MNLDFLGLVFKDIKKRKFSSFLTLFAISLGIASIFLISLLTIGLGESFTKQFEEFGANRLYVSSATSSFTSSTQTEGLTDNDLDYIKGRPYVDEVYPYYFKSYQAKYGNEFQTVRVIGTTLSEDYFEQYNMDVEVGRHVKPNEKYSLLIGPVAATDIFSKDLAVGSNVYIKDTKFKVVGILESLGNPEDDRSVYANIDTLRDIDEAGDDVGIFDVTIVEGYDVTLAKDNLQTLLDNKFGEDEVVVTSPDQILGIINNILYYITVIFGGIGVISLIVGSLGIINTMFVIITEKTRDIGIMKSIGATNEQVLTLFIFQAGVFGFLGSILGVIIGYAFVKLAELAFVYGLQMTFVSFPFDYKAALSLIVFGFVIGCVSGFIPSYKGSKINIIDAVRKWCQ